MIRYTKIIYRIIKRWWNYRERFSSYWQVLFAIYFRFRAIKKLRGESLKLVSLKLKGYGEPVFLRLGTEDIVIFEEIFLKDEYSESIEHIDEAAGWVIDLGGNIGLAARFFLEKLPSCRVLSIEPDAGNIQVLRKNLETAMFTGRSRYLEAFISDTAGKSAIYRNSGPAGYRMSHSTQENDQELIDCVRMIDVLDEAGIQDLLLLKCDIEGAEEQLFSDCSEWISKVQNIVVETHQPYTPELLESDLRKSQWSSELVSLTTRDQYAVVQYKAM